MSFVWIAWFEFKIVFTENTIFNSRPILNMFYAKHFVNIFV